ncbi:O-antigen translocase [Haloflavibacter putidus]|uniref:O-antigen translocase n=1 Tax=Haloflavibacter putidus TaxID=2576776 RepID=A0A507ZP98_9FLAO|nr:O-antigen translocase [Haloflavibacter putidus]TQD38817.1 O-antigen translocase [Haloflavibacter putidus]
MNFFKTSILSSINTVVNMVLRLATNKLIAVYIGSEGFALIGQFKDFLKLGLSIGQLGLDKGIIKYVAENQEKPEQLRRVLSTAFIAQLVMSVVLALLVFFFRNQILMLLLGSSTYSEIFMLVSFSIIPMVLFTSLLGILNGLHEVTRYVLISIIANICGSLLTIAFIYFFGITGVLYSLGINQFINFSVALFFLRKSSFQIDWIKQKFEKSEFRKLLKFSAMFISGTVSLSITLIAVRKYLTVHFGLDYAGYWEAMWRISAIYLTFLTSAFGLYLLPTFSKLNVKYLRKEIFKIWKITIPLSIIAALGLYFLRDFVIQLIYSEKFLIISGLFLFQLMGDFLKINGWILGNLLIAKAHAKAFIFFQVGWALLFYASINFWVARSGFTGVAIAYFTTYFIHFVMMNIYFRKLLWRKSIQI